MIRRTSIYYHKKGNAFSDNGLKTSSYSAIKSNALMGSNCDERMNMTSHPPSIHFNIGHPSGNVRNSNHSKRLTGGSFYGKRDGAGRLNDDHLPRDIQDHLNILDGDSHDQLVFPWKDLEDDVHILTTNENTGSVGSDSSSQFDNFGSTSFPSVRSSSNTWPKTQSFYGPDLGKLSVDGLSIGKDYQKGIDEKDLHSKNPDDFMAPVHQTRHKHWTEREDDILRSATLASGTSDWEFISAMYFDSSRNATQCRNRWKNYLQPGIVRGQWSLTEDKLIVKMVSEGYMWRDIAARIPRRTGESVRARYVNHLDPTLKRSKWTKKEDEILFEAQRRIGNKWSEIRTLLPGRSDNAIKNRYHNKKKAFLRKIKKCKTEQIRKNPTIGSTKPMKKIGIDSQRSTTQPNSTCVEDFPDAVISI